MPSYSRGDIALIQYPFTDLTGSKVRPTVVVSAAHESKDVIFVPLTSRTWGLLSGEFVLVDHRGAGLNVPTAAKRGFHTVDEQRILQVVGTLARVDFEQLERSMLYWLGVAAQP